MQRRTEDRAEGQSVQGFDDVLDLMIHELRNPIAVVKGFASTFANNIEKMSPDQLVAGSRAMLRAADKLDSLLRTFADVRSLDTESIALHRTDVLLSRLVDETVLEQTLIVEDHTLELTIEDDVLLNVDEVRVRQILTNLITNAVKYSPRGTPIEIVASRDGEAVHICVRDHGDGIPASRTEDVFDKFSRISDDVSGTGIGLYISRGFARAHGGDLLLSDAGREGCTFTIVLPIHEAGSDDKPR